MKKINELIENVIGKNLDKKELNLISKKIESKLITNKPKFTFIDLFAGVGGIRTGFEQVQGKCVFTSEWDRYAQLTYFCNFGDLPHGDITQVKLNEIPEHDILLAGFPCQAFSIAGERKGFEDTRGTLFFDVARIIKDKRPKAFLLENVKGLLSHDGGKTYAVIIETLKSLNYEVYTNVLNTMDYANIPQTRERLYIVGFNKKKLPQIDFEFPKKRKLVKTISDILLKEKQDEYYYYNRFSIFADVDKKVIRKDTVYQWRRVYVRENKSNVCPTLTANMGTGGHNVPLVRDDFGVRKLTPRECARLQGFPDNFYIPSFLAKSHVYKQFGNSVSVPVIKLIAEKMIEVFEANRKTSVSKKTNNEIYQ